MSTAQLPTVIRDKLLAMDRQQRELAAISNVGRFLCLAAAAVGGCLLADIFGNLPPAVRTGLLAGLALLLILGIGCRFARPFHRRKSWAELAAAVEQDHPELKERLTTLVELRTTTEIGRGSSPLMQDLLARQTVNAVSRLEFSETLPAGRSLRQGMLGLAALAVLLMPFLMPGSRYALSWQRLFVPWGNYDWGHRLSFQIPNGDRIVARGGDVTLRAALHGRYFSADAPLAVTLHWSDDRRQSQQQSMTWIAEELCYAATIPNVEQNIDYHVRCAAAASRDYRITVADRPRIADWQLEIQPPGYTGLPAQTLHAAVTELTVPERSRLTFRLRFAEPVATATLLWPEAFVEPSLLNADNVPPETKIRQVEFPLELSADRQSAAIERLATADGPFHIQLASKLGLASESLPQRLVLIPDEPPRIAVDNSDGLTAIRSDDLLSISLHAADDYGLSAVELHWETSTDQIGQRQLSAEELTNRAVDIHWELDVAEWKLSPGQAVTYRLKAVDNRPVPGPQEMWTEPVTVAISRDAELMESRALTAAQKSLERELAALKNALSKQHAAADRLHRQTARDAVRGTQQPENQTQLDEVQAGQQALREHWEALQKELGRRPMMAQPAADHLPKLKQQLEQAEHSMQQAATAVEARDQIEQLSKALDRLAQAENQLQELERQSKSLAALEQELAELSRLSRKADKLADQAEALDRRPADADDAAKPSETEAMSSPESRTELKNETEQLAAHLDDLLRRRPELLEAARQNELERLAQLADRAEKLAQREAELAESLNREAARQPANDPPAGKNTDALSNDDVDAADRQVAEAVQQQHDVARAAAALNNSTENTDRRTQENAASGAKGENVKSADGFATPNSPENEPLSEFADRSQAAADAARSGDLPQAAEFSRQASQAAERAARFDASSQETPQPAARDQAGELAKQQESLADRFEQLAKSSTARREAQQQSQQGLEQATNALSQALQQSATQLSQQPLNLPKSGKAASAASQSAQSAGKHMQAAVESLTPGDTPAAGQHAQAAAEKLQQSAHVGKSAADEAGEGSPQSALIPKSTAGKVAQAANQLKQAQQQLAEPTAAEQPSNSPSKPTATSSDATPPAGDQPGGTTANPGSPSNLERSAGQLRQAAQLLAAACQACQQGETKAASTGRPAQQIAGKPADSQDPAQSAAGPTAIAGEGSEPSSELESIAALSKPSAGMRNWGRLPKNLQTEILQGSAKKAHPEYSRQIKNYFERIAKPAGKQNRP